MRVAARSGAIRAGCAPDPATNRPWRSRARLRCPTRITDSSGARGLSPQPGDTPTPPAEAAATCGWVCSAIAAPPRHKDKQVDVNLEMGGDAQHRRVGRGGPPGDALPDNRCGDRYDVLQPAQAGLVRRRNQRVAVLD